MEYYCINMTLYDSINIYILLDIAPHPELFVTIHGIWLLKYIKRISVYNKKNPSI